MSNAERQRQFRERHPGYYARIQARKRASAKRGAAIAMAKIQAYVAGVEAVLASMKVAPLALPAPAVVPILPGINTIAARPAPEPLTRPISKSLAA